MLLRDAIVAICRAYDGLDADGVPIRPDGWRGVTDVLLGGLDWTVARTDGDITGSVDPLTGTPPERWLAHRSYSAFTIHGEYPPSADIPRLNGHCMAVLDWACGLLQGNWVSGGGNLYLSADFDPNNQVMEWMRNPTYADEPGYPATEACGWPVAGGIGMGYAWADSYLRGDGALIAQALFHTQLVPAADQEYINAIHAVSDGLRRSIAGLGATVTRHDGKVLLETPSGRVVSDITRLPTMDGAIARLAHNFQCWGAGNLVMRGTKGEQLDLRGGLLIPGGEDEP